jgi:hypothetical protein
MWIAAHSNFNIAIEQYAGAADVLLDVWNQVSVHDSEVERLGSETFPVLADEPIRRLVAYTEQKYQICGLEVAEQADQNDQWDRNA